MSRSHRVRWTERAVRDVEGILDWVEGDSGLETARAVYGAIESALGTLAEMPVRCRVVAELREHGITAYRELACEPYRIVFRVRGRVVVLLGVFDRRRDLEELLLERALEHDS